MDCLKCRARNSPDAVFCENCGSQLEVVCPNCGGANWLSAKFCKKCGQQLLEAAPATLVTAGKFGSVEAYAPKHLAEKIRISKNALEGERKQITVLFADMKGSMEMVAGRDAEEARELLHPVLKHMMEAVHHYEGTVNNIMGDGIMALFGAPLAHEDHAIRACYAALRMQDSVKRYAKEVSGSEGIPIGIRVGVNSGEVVVGSIGNDLRMDYSAIGETVHLAARMEQLATPGSILITADTLCLAEGYVDVNSLGPISIKGLSEPVEVCEVTETGPVRTPIQAAAARGLTRFVGRCNEIHALQEALEQASIGRGQVVAAVGEPGVGKSRLFYEFTRSHWTGGWFILESRSSSYGKAFPYLPIVELTKAYCRIESGDDSRNILEKVKGKLLTLDHDLEPTLPAFLSLLDIAVEDPNWHALDPTQRRERILDAVKRLLLRESQAKPLLLVFEDLQWIDSETQAVLENLIESVSTAQILLLVNYRPEYQHGWGNKTYYTQLRIDPLPPESVEELLRDSLGDNVALQPLKRLLVARTEGNPFFLEEIVRTLVETKALSGNRGTYHMPKVHDEIQVPATIHAVLAARIDRLPPQQKQLLQSASVIGETVPFTLLQAIVEMSEEELRCGLACLQAAEFISEANLYPELEYAFKHGLTHEVAYKGLLLDHRRKLHSRIVADLEVRARKGSAEVERLAHHAVRGEVWDKATTYCQKAGVSAYDRAAFHEAVTFFEQAIQALAHLPEHSDTRDLAIEIRLALDSPLRALGEHTRRLALLDEARALARTLDDQVRLERILAKMALVLRTTGDLDGATAAGHQALELAGALGDGVLQAEASLTLGQIYYSSGDFGRAADLVRRSVEAADRELDAPITDLRIESKIWLAQISSALGTFAEGRRHGEEALQLATLAGRGATVIIVHACLGDLYLAQGRVEHAIQVLEQGVALCRASGMRSLLRQTTASLGYAAALQGRLAEGRALLEEGISEALSTGGLIGNACRVAWLSEVYRLAGNREEAWQHARQALDLSRQYKQRGNEAIALYQLGVVHAHADPPDTKQAEAHYQEALTLAEELGMRPLQAHCQLGRGTVYTTTNRRQQARAALTAAIDLYRTMDMTFWLPRAEAALAQLA